MRSSEIRKLLRSGDHAAHDTRHIHDLARALVRERLHLSDRAAKPAAAADLLWDREGRAYKVVSRSVLGQADLTTFDVSLSTDADFLLAVLLRRGDFALIEMVRLPWPTVLWLGSITGDRIRLRWAEASPAYAVAERL